MKITRRTRRLSVIGGACICNIGLCLYDFVVFFYHQPYTIDRLTLCFFSEILTALPFLVVGSLIFWHTAQRSIGRLIFLFCFFMMVVFVVEPGATINNPWLDAAATLGSTLAIVSLGAIFLVFPVRETRAVQARLYRLTLSCTGSVLCLWTLCGILFPSPPDWFIVGKNIAYLIVLLTILIHLLYLFRVLPAQEKQHMRFLIVGLFLATMPFIFMTLLPQILGEERYTVSGEFSTIFFICIPLSIGIGVNQLLIDHALLYRAIVIISRCSSMVILLFLYSLLLFKHASAFNMLFLLFPFICVFVWSGSKWMLDTFFFKERKLYQKMIEEKYIPLHTMTTLTEVTERLIETVRHTLSTYTLAYGYNENLHLYQVIDTAHPNQDYTTWIQTIHHTFPVLPSEIEAPRMQPLAKARLLVCTPQGMNTAPLFPAFPPDQEASTHLLLAPINVTKTMSGFLVVATQTPFDITILTLIIELFASHFEQARQYEQTTQQIRLLEQLMQGHSTSPAPQDFITIAAAATQNNAEFWTFDAEDQSFTQSIVVGPGPHMPTVPLTATPLWHDTHFVTDPKQENALFAAFPYSFAWLPLRKEQNFYGAIVLSYIRTHYFSIEEKYILQLYGDRCSNEMIAQETQRHNEEIYAQKQRIAQMKNSFISEALIHLRQPLEDMQTYLRVYSATSPDGEALQHIKEAGEKFLEGIEVIETHFENDRKQQKKRSTYIQAFYSENEKG